MPTEVAMDRVVGESAAGGFTRRPDDRRIHLR
jgi:hypothetical protein